MKFALNPTIQTCPIASDKRSKSHPTVPTFAESTGLPDLVVGASIGVLVKSGTSSEIIDKLASDIGEAMNSPDVASKIEGLGMEITRSVPKQYADAIGDEQRRYGEMVKISGASID